MLDEMSYFNVWSLLLSFTFLSMLPHPGVLNWPTISTVPRSARRACKCPFAAHPPFSIKSLRRNSSNHTSPNFGSPSSVALFLDFMGFLTPNMMTLILLMLGLPDTDILAVPFVYTKTSEMLNDDPGSSICRLRSSFAACSKERSISKLFSAGHTLALWSSTLLS